ncbi:AraC family transcriptional regulator [Frigidibacter mobilis]|uniref:AraC family transcriptional regulator n=1 Tax=Frigidibacter mobilis TaxID=1335048 RepID=A0A159Z1M1_9RHOB|nr:AraC family transcriptional regulator [Frigidibacter mobilis]AMY68865.1 AraC family transcriptional regulator [Frigidibacter mobilis]
MRLIRAATFLGFSEAATEVGVDADNVLRAVGLSAEKIADPDTLVPLDAFFDALALVARKSGATDFGVRAASRRGTPDLGPVTLLMRDAETVEEAINYYSSHIAMHAAGFALAVDDRLGSPLIQMELRGRSHEASIQAAHFAVAGTVMTIRWLLRDDFRPEFVSFSHGKPVTDSFAQQFFRCPISYNQTVSGIIVKREDLLQPVRTSSPFMRRQAQKYLFPFIPSPERFGLTVQRLVAQLLLEGDCSASRIAEHLGLDRRTLNRKLAKEGETFSSVLQKVRVELTLRYIADVQFPLTELAGIVGFSGLSSFSRWFQETFGCSASAWRADPALREQARNF